MVMPKLGDVIAIPVTDKIFATAKIIWISSEYKDVFGFVLLHRLFDSPVFSEIEEEPYQSVPIYSGPVFVLYGDIKNVENGDWRIIGNLPIKSKDKDLLYHNIAGKLCRGDEYIKELPDDELLSYPKFLNAGNQAVISMIKAAFSLSSESE
ncbi:MAG: immunity 26/phosphotriesterase HocA family protein [Candidatus Thiodiazotropha sp. (ex Lucinoma borealis)]|nr:immunity 26/phosphotriesterase HocA family protein [Candidatus Thiodiazotropha sp. (ex Lucinoma borealis)]